MEKLIRFEEQVILVNKNLITILLKHGADVNLKCGGKGNSGLMWAAWRNNLPIVKYLIENGADINALNHRGENALDISICRMSYHTALFLKQQGMKPKDKCNYENKLAIDFNLDYFLECLEKESDVANYSAFFINTEEFKDCDDKESIYLDTLHNDQNQQRNEYIYINREDSNDPSSGLFISDKDFDCLSDLEGKLGSARLLNTEIKNSSDPNEEENSLEPVVEPIWK